MASRTAPNVTRFGKRVVSDSSDTSDTYPFKTRCQKCQTLLTNDSADVSRVRAHAPRLRPAGVGLPRAKARGPTHTSFGALCAADLSGSHSARRREDAMAAGAVQGRNRRAAGRHGAGSGRGAHRRARPKSDV